MSESSENNQEATYVNPHYAAEYKYVKARIGAQDGYKVFLEGELLGRVIKDWEKVWGGDCWTIRGEGRPKVTFGTRRDAANYLRDISKETT